MHMFLSPEEKGALKDIKNLKNRSTMKSKEKNGSAQKKFPFMKNCDSLKENESTSLASSANIIMTVPYSEVEQEGSK